MWKDLFHFTRSEKRGVVTLFLLLAILVVAPFVMPYFIAPQQSLNSEFFTELETFKLSLQEKENTHQTFERRNFGTRNNSAPQIKRFIFNPNELDSLGFISLGIRPFVVRNILNYRRKGGKFRKAEDFSRIYGMLPEVYQELAPFIFIETYETTAKTSGDSTKVTEAPKEFLVIELNSADTTALKQLRGIGSYFAKQIVRHRTRLGGFTHPEQLLEIYNFRQETYERILPHITIDTTNLAKINVNRASVERLRAHPYLNFYNAKAIYEHRRNHRRLSSIADLENLPDLPPEVLEKMKPYLEFLH